MKLKVILEQLQEEVDLQKYKSLLEFLSGRLGKMTVGTAYYVASMDSSMNKKLSTGEPNPMYGKLFKNTRFTFPWKDTYARALERKGVDKERGPRKGQYDKLEGSDVLETGKSGLYLPILPEGVEYEYSVLNDQGEFEPISKEEVKPYLRPYVSKPEEETGVKFRVLIVDKIAKLTGGGRTWVNEHFEGEYMGPGKI